MTACSREDIYRGTMSTALKDLLKEFTATLEQAAVSEGADAAKAVGEKARDILARANVLVDEIAENAGKARIAAAEGRGHLEDTIRKQPLLAIGIAAAAGFLLASLRRR